MLNADSGFVAGKNIDAAKVAVIEMFDYHCGYCKRAAGQVKELTRNDPDVKVIFRELPILREESDIGAEFALAAREQGKFLDFHFAIRSNHVIAAEMGIEGTPAFIVATLDGNYIDFINGYSEAALKEKISEAKKAAK